MVSLCSRLRSIFNAEMNVLALLRVKLLIIPKLHIICSKFFISCILSFVKTVKSRRPETSVRACGLFYSVQEVLRLYANVLIISLCSMVFIFF